VLEFLVISCSIAISMPVGNCYCNTFVVANIPGGRS